MKWLSKINFLKWIQWFAVYVSRHVVLFSIQLKLTIGHGTVTLYWQERNIQVPYLTSIEFFCELGLFSMLEMKFSMYSPQTIAYFSFQKLMTL